MIQFCKCIYFLFHRYFDKIKRCFIKLCCHSSCIDQIHTLFLKCLRCMICIGATHNIGPSAYKSLTRDHPSYTTTPMFIGWGVIRELLLRNVNACMGPNSWQSRIIRINNKGVRQFVNRSKTAVVYFCTQAAIVWSIFLYACTVPCTSCERSFNVTIRLWQCQTIGWHNWHYPLMLCRPKLQFEDRCQWQ